MNRSEATPSDLSPAEIERLWLQEAQRRSDAYDRGEVKAVPGKQVFRRLWREILGQ